MKRGLFFLAALGLLLGGVGQARAGSITVDENGIGIGVIGLGFLAPDPGPGGLPGVLTYNLPFAGLQGDVLLRDGSITGPVLDVIRFNGNGTLIFYSDTPPTDSLGDTPSPPTVLYPNQATVVEIGPEGANSAVYTPTANQPGFDGSNPTYTFISDGNTVPEPASLTLLGIGIAGMAGYGWRKRKMAQAR